MQPSRIVFVGTVRIAPYSVLAMMATACGSAATASGVVVDGGRDGTFALGPDSAAGPDATAAPDAAAGPDAAVGTDTGLPVGDASGDAPTDGALLVLCEAGDYFVQVVDDAGTRYLRSDCSEAGGPPSLVLGICAEDLAGMMVVACSGATSIRLCSQIGGSGAGDWPVSVQYSDSEGGPSNAAGYATMHITTFPPDGGTIAGDYAGLITWPGDDSGTGRALSGAFCLF
jgi:hypothetical protein